jgi:PBP1b-binding outer membrane lipoprotein LpoB
MIMMKRFGLLFFVAMLFVGCTNTQPKWDIGSQVCFKQTGKQATVAWWYGDQNRTKIPLYKVTSVNDLNQAYEIQILEIDLQECSTK